MSDAKNIFKVKLFLKAKDEVELIQLQLKNNSINNMMYDYGTPQKIDDGFIIWFYADVTKYRRVK